MRKDISNQKFGKWTVLSFDKIKGRMAYWHCKCDCGTLSSVSVSSLNRGDSTCCLSCGRSKRTIDPPAICGQWTVTNEVVSKLGQLHRVCVCSCGNKGIISYYRLVHGKAECCTKCAPRINAKKGVEDPSYKGTANISGTYFGRLKAKAKINKVEFNITIHELQDLLEVQNFKCALSGMDIKYNPNIGVKANQTTNLASVDRIDSSKGYVKGNIQWVHKDINTMKMDLNQNQFIDYCRKIVAYGASK